MSDKMLKKILVVITENFSNGVRADFITETKIRRAYKVRYGNEEIPAAFNLSSFIKKAAFCYGDKYYFVTALNRSRVFRLIDTVLNTGNIIVYYDELFAKYRGKFCDWHVNTPAVLGALLRTSDSPLYFSDKYLAVSKFVRVSDVIEYAVKTLPADATFTVEQIHEKLPYVPADEIELSLSNSPKYLKTVNGKYLLTEQISFDAAEIKAVRQTLLNDLKTDGHAIFNMQDFPSTLALNPELGEMTLRKLVFDRFLSKDFSLRGNILTMRGTVVNGTKLLRRFCSARDELTINELTDRAKKLGLFRHSTIIDVASESMIRVSKNVFVKAKFIKFDTMAIDEALSPFVQGKIIALRDVTSFAKFKPVKDTRGYEWEWNLYLLESFLRKGNGQYKLHTPSTTNLSKGAICPCEKIFVSYIDLMSAVVVQEKIPLNTNSISRFLSEKSFHARRLGGVATSIIERAQARLV